MTNSALPWISATARNYLSKAVTKIALGNNMDPEVLLKQISSPDIGSLADPELADLLHEIETECYERAISTTDRQSRTGQAKDLNRCAYSRVPTLTYCGDPRTNEVSGHTINPWRFDNTRVSASALMHLAIPGSGPQDVLRVQHWMNSVVEPSEDGYMEYRQIVAMSEFKMSRQLWLQGYAVVAGNVAIRMASPIGKALEAMFPDKIDYGAYVASVVNAPVIPHAGEAGRAMKVIFMRLTDSQGKDLKTDGSGWCHPQATGGFALQIRGVNINNRLFAKGMVFPRDGFAELVAAVDPTLDPVNTLVLDWNQIKGYQKPYGESMRSVGGVETMDLFVGFINRWTKPQTISGGFELLQQIQQTPETLATIDKLISTKLKTMRKQGREGLLRRAGRDDVQIREMIQVATGLGLDPLGFPIIHARCMDLLGKELYSLTQGAGISGRQHVLRLDSTVPRGSVVIPGYRIGSEIAAYRFPILMAQGLKVLKVCGPTGLHQIRDGELTPFTVIMNDLDAVDMQGDDDGDIVGILHQKPLVELFRSRLHDKTLAVELPGKAPKYKGESYSQGGLEYLATDHTGPVGLYTVFQAQLHAVGDVFGAMLMCFAIQAAVDAAKKQSILIDLPRALTTDHSRLAPEDRVIITDAQGVGRVNPKWILKTWNPRTVNRIAGKLPAELSTSWRIQPQAFNMYYSQPVVGFYDQNAIAAAVSKVMTSRGCFWTDADGKKRVKNPIKVWRCKSKSQNPVSWNEVTDDRFTNFVHSAYEITRSYWRVESWVPKLVDMDWNAIAHIIPQKVGVRVTTSYEQYRNTLATDRGLRAFGPEMFKALLRNGQRKAEQLSKINQVVRNLDLAMSGCTPEEMAAIWWHEINHATESFMTKGTKTPGPGYNNALRALCAGSHRVLAHIGLTKEEAVCPALNTQMYEQVVNRAYSGDSHKAVATLWTMMSQSTRHEKIVDGVHLLQCPTCSQTMRDQLIKLGRTTKGDETTAALSQLLTDLMTVWAEAQRPVQA